MKNIIKRVLVGVCVGVILMSIRSCNVNATSIKPTLSNCGMFYSTNTSMTGTTGTATYNSLAYNTCSVSSSNSKIFTATRFNYQSTGITNGTYIFQFLVKNTTNRVQTPSIAILSGSTNSSYSTNFCYVSASDGLSIEIPLTQTTNYIGNTSLNYYSVYCPNVEMKSGWFQVFVQGGANTESVTSLYAISQDFNITKVVSNEDIKNSIDTQTQQQHTDSQDTQNAINDVNDSITSSSTPSSSDTSSAYSSFDNATAQNGVITSLITLPIQLFTNINNNINTSCTRFDMGTLLGTHIYFNCINPANYIGSQLWSVIDILMSGFFVWYIGKKLIKVFENLSSMKEGDPVGD